MVNSFTAYTFPSSAYLSITSLHSLSFCISILLPTRLRASSSHHALHLRCLDSLHVIVLHGVISASSSFLPFVRLTILCIMTRTLHCISARFIRFIICISVCNLNPSTFAMLYHRQICFTVYYYIRTQYNSDCTYGNNNWADIVNEGVKEG